MNDEPPPPVKMPPSTPIKPVEDDKLLGGRKKTLKTFPRGILKTAKIKPVADPARAPPLKKSIRKHTIRVLTEKGVQHHRKTLKRKVAKMSDEKVRHLAMKAGLVKDPKTPIHIQREMVYGGLIAGFVSSE